METLTSNYVAASCVRHVTFPRVFPMGRGYGAFDTLSSLFTVWDNSVYGAGRAITAFEGANIIHGGGGGGGGSLSCPPPPPPPPPKKERHSD